MNNGQLIGRLRLDAERHETEIVRLRGLVEAKNEALRELADSSKYMLFGADCPGGAHVGWMAYGRPDKIAQSALNKE